MNKKSTRKLSSFVLAASIAASSLFISSPHVNKSYAATNQVGQINTSTTIPVLFTGNVTATKINVRTSPVNTSTIFVTLSKGAKVSIVETSGPWYKIKTSKGYGWVMSNYVTQVTTLPVLFTGNVTATKINVRTSPENTSKVFVTLSKGAKVSIVEKKDLWYKIKTSKGYGWVMSKYVSQTNAEVLPVIDTGTITATKINVRKEPKNTSTVFVTLSKGGKVSIVEKINLWYKIKTSKGYGWVMSNYVKTASSTTPPTDGDGPTTPTIPIKDKFGKVTASSLNVRKGPGTQYATIKALSSGTIVELKGENNGWYQIVFGTITGWVSKSYIKIVDQQDAELGDFTLVIDPGHGGTDPGTTFKTSSGVTLKESVIVLSVSKYLKTYLNNLPINSYFTRETDVYPTLTQRVSFAESKKADAFISIHINSTPSHTGDGTETYYYGEAAARATTASKEKLADSMAFADFVQKRLVEKLKLDDRGTKSGNFHVIRESSMASILTELGFVDNPKDNVKLASPSWQKEAAKGIYLGILDYLAYQGYNVDSYYL
jgi:N-acetylmuramoyl-L-alanine amidase